MLTDWLEKEFLRLRRDLLTQEIILGTKLIAVYLF